MTTRHLSFSVESCSLSHGRLRITSGVCTLHPQYTPEQHAKIVQMLDDGARPVCLLKLSDTEVTIVSVTQDRCEPTVNCAMRGVA
jgi:hypothetical protein